MAAAPAAKPRATRAKAAPAKAPEVTVSPADFHRVATDITTNILIERAGEMRRVILASLSGVNLHQLGPAGVAKSLGLRSYAQRIIGARYFEKLVHAQMPADAILGGYDMPRFAKTGEFVRASDHYMPGAHIVFLDEVTRANGPTIDAILPMWNSEERAAEHNGGMRVTNIAFAVSASNFMPDPDDAERGAFIDRLTLMDYIEPVKLRESFEEMIERHHRRRVGMIDGSLTMETVTLEQFLLAQRQVTHVRPTPDYKSAASKLREATTAEGIYVSDRRWMELGRVCRAAAWLAGRDFLIPEDLVAVENGLWRMKEQRAVAHKLVLPFHGRYEREAQKFREEAEPQLAKIDEVRPDVEATPPGTDLPTEILNKALSATRGIDACKARVDAVLAEAVKEQRAAASLRELSDELLVTQKWLAEYGLPTQYLTRRP